MKYITFIFTSLLIFSSVALAGTLENRKDPGQEKNIALGKLKSCYSRLIAMTEAVEDNDCTDVGFEWCINTGLMTALATATPTELSTCENSLKSQYMSVLNTSLVGQKSVAGTISCDEIAKDSTHKKLDELALKAKLVFRDVSRYHEDVVSGLCSGKPEDIETINKIVDFGSVSANDAESIARVLGKKYTAPARTADGKLFERINNGLSDKGLCWACAGNIASEYVKEPQGDIAKMVDAALSGDADALQKLQNGNYTQPISTKADATVTVKAEADRGDAEAQEKLGDIYFKQDNSAEAVKYYRMAADQKNAHGETALGNMYEFGFGNLPIDAAEAAKWYQKAADQDYADAKYKLASLYSRGEGVKEDKDRAMKLYHEAAEQGHSDAQTMLGIFYENGDGFTKDYDEAVKWYRKAVEQGSVDAEERLGLLYSIGGGVPKDMKEAYFWATIASVTNKQDIVQGEADEFRQRLEGMLTPEEANAIGARAREWVKAHPAPQ